MSPFVLKYHMCRETIDLTELDFFKRHKVLNFHKTCVQNPNLATHHFSSSKDFLKFITYFLLFGHSGTVSEAANRLNRNLTFL